MRSRTKHVLGSVIAATLLSSGAAACGSGSSTSASSTTTAAVPSTVATGPGVGRPPVVLGTKNFTEEFILGQLYAQALRAKGFRVTLMNNLGASEVIERKLASGTVDAYPEYTGTILSTLAHQTSRPASAYTAYQRAASFERAHGATLLAMAPAQDTDVLVTKPAYAARHRLRSLADLARLGSSVTLAAPPEFRTRFNGLVGLRQVYGVGAVRFVPVKIGTQYRALEQGQAQVAAVFTTDGNLSQGGYTLLEDPRDIFGFQNVTFVIRKDTLAREGPDFQRTVDAVSARLSTQALRVMNAAVDLDQQSPDAVARQFLRANGLI